MSAVHPNIFLVLSTCRGSRCVTDTKEAKSKKRKRFSYQISQAIRQGLLARLHQKVRRCAPIRLKCSAGPYGRLQLDGGRVLVAGYGAQRCGRIRTAEEADGHGQYRLHHVGHSKLGSGECRKVWIMDYRGTYERAAGRIAIIRVSC